jgi:hypothetical protein
VRVENVRLLAVGGGGGNWLATMPTSPTFVVEAEAFMHICSGTLLVFNNNTNNWLVLCLNIVVSLITGCIYVY